MGKPKPTCFYCETKLAIIPVDDPTFCSNNCLFDQAMKDKKAGNVIWCTKCGGVWHTKGLCLEEENTDEREKMSSLQDFVEENLEGCLWEEKEILLKLSEEVGELIQAVRKKGPEEVKHEIGDVAFALLAFCIKRNEDVEDCLDLAIDTHLNKLSKTWKGNYQNGERVE